VSLLAKTLRPTRDIAAADRLADCAKRLLARSVGAHQFTNKISPKRLSALLSVESNACHLVACYSGGSRVHQADAYMAKIAA
jgi:hypothetical protein